MVRRNGGRDRECWRGEWPRNALRSLEHEATGLSFCNVQDGPVSLIIGDLGYIQKAVHPSCVFAAQGLEKYVMTKLFPRAFCPSTEETEVDEQLSDKISRLQQFIRPEHLDIPANFQNESSWLVRASFCCLADLLFG